MVFDWKEYERIARQIVAEGCVLLKNDKHVLPLQTGCKIAVFGRIQRHYYKSGTGSGGMVNVSRVTGILDALLEEPELLVDRELLEVYDKWEETNPYDEGIGWASEPWSQQEMPVEMELARACSERNDVAVIILGRSAGEDRDTVDEEGAYRLSAVEAKMIENVTACFDKVVLLLNVGSILDMSHPSLERCQALLYVWQGGMIGGYGVADILSGRVNPSGRMADTVAQGIEDYPSTRNFGDLERNYYQEDIYVGYRYFETVAQQTVLYPFGYGLSYTEFSETVQGIEEQDEAIVVTVAVENIGDKSGKQVVQIYVESPQGKLGKPSRVLAGFAKTKTLAPGETQSVRISLSQEMYASYDDSGVTGEAFCYVLEAGEYRIYVGENVRQAELAGTFSRAEQVVIKRLTQNMAPVLPFQRMKPERSSDGAFHMIEEAVPIGAKDEEAKRQRALPTEIPYTGDVGYKLEDVVQGRVSMEDLVAQMSDEDLSSIIRGEGMGSPKVTPGTAAAYGGVSKHLDELGIPCGCCSDGPSGMRIDCGIKAFSLPSGTLMACTFNPELVQKLYSLMGLEMRSNRIDNLLGPGMNIHRNPLNGRNFEYFSEDPFLTGKMGAAQILGLKSSGVTGTIKHFAGNNQETSRTDSDSVVSERALREIYLKGFEIAVREGGADSVMTTYGSLNGVWTAGRYELNTAILRDEWGFNGIVMTDWWAKISSQGRNEEARGNDFASMIRAQNDIYMVCPEGDKNLTEDNTLEQLQTGELSRGELQRSAMNICRQLTKSPAYLRKIGQEEKVEVIHRPEEAGDFNLEDIVYHEVDRDAVISLEDVDTSKDSSYVFAIAVNSPGIYEMEFEYASNLEAMAQIPMTIFTQSVPVGVITFNGTGDQWKTVKKRVYIATKYVVARLYFAQSGARLKELRLHQIQELQEEIGPMLAEGDFDMAFR